MCYRGLSVAKDPIPQSRIKCTLNWTGKRIHFSLTIQLQCKDSLMKNALISLTQPQTHLQTELVEPSLCISS